MQDLHSVATAAAAAGGGGGGTGRILAGDRRMRPHPNQALKCPRCDSLNTKFCYYNNYNLSQPRHFCKSCRRYWTKGGVLRNVPVGGGCRKTKRSKPKESQESQRERKSTSHSSSESSTLTAATTEVSATSASDLFHFADFPAKNPSSSEYPTPLMENLDQASDPAVFATTGSFTSMMAEANPAGVLGFGFSDLSGSPRVQQNTYTNMNNNLPATVEELKMEELSSGFLDHNLGVDLPPLQGRQCNGELTELNWQCNGGQGLFDMTTSVDQPYLWGQSQWVDTDQSLYLP